MIITEILAQYNPASSPQNLFTLLIDCVRRYPANLAYIYSEEDSEYRVSYEQLLAKIIKLAASFHQYGITRGDKVLLLADNRYEWILSDQALMCCGAVSVPRGADTPDHELQFIAEDSAARHLIVETGALLDKYQEGFLKTANFTNIFIMAGSGLSTAGFGETPYEELFAREDDLQQVAREVFDRGLTIQPDDLLTLIYTSGTTGMPKGVELTHANIMHNVQCIPDLIELSETDRWLSILPSWHIFERTAEYVALSRGTTLVYSSVKTFAEDLEKYQPTLVATVPRVWESLYSRVWSKIRKKGKFASHLFALLLWVSSTYRRNLRRGLGRLPVFTRERSFAVPRWCFAWLTVVLLFPASFLANKKLAAVRDRFGGRLRLAISGGGSLAEYLEEWIDAVGIRIVNAYGMTECSPAIAGRGLHCRIFGTVGPPVPGTELRIVDDEGNSLADGLEGKIEVRGEQVTRGYHNNEKEHRASFTSDGFFKTGDLGKLTVTGELVLTGRAKEIIVLSNGENVDPTRIENTITRFPFIQDVMLVGQDKRGLGALLVPEMEELRRYLAEKFKGVAAKGPLLKDAAVVAIIKKDINRLLQGSQGFRPHERLLNIAFLDHPFTLGEEVTITLKKKRHVIEQKYRPLINDLLS
jgi:long-chain acyl-CoA synthetase